MALIHAWIPDEGGALALGPRPGKRTFPELMAATDVLTLLSDSEGSSLIGSQIESMGLHWWSLPLLNGQPFGPGKDASIDTLFLNLKQRLSEGAQLYVHCSAGIHRTGMIGAALLYSLGFDDAAVRKTLLELRPHTSEGVGEERLAVAKRFFRKQQDPKLR